MEGTIKWYNGDRGYGFIEPADGGADIFFHASVLEPDMQGENGPRPGEPVTFEVVDGPRGPEAAGVGRVAAPAR
ncbi:MAG: cold-shock protein [Alphaproteobacteria bacterium]